MEAILYLVGGFIGVVVIAAIAFFGLIILIDLFLSFINSPNTFDF